MIRFRPVRMVCLLAVSAVAAIAGGDDKVLFDFESGTYEGWTAEGGATFGKTPFLASAEVPKWRADRTFDGWQGKYMVIAGDTRPAKVPPGKLTSNEFVITHPYLKFLFGAEVHPRARVSLLIGGREVRTAFGNNSYEMRLRGWDVTEFRNQKARIAIEDAADVESLLRVDYFHLSDTPPPAIGAFDKSRQESDLIRYGELKLVFDPGPGLFVAHANIVRGLDARWHMYAQMASLEARETPDEHKTIWHATAESPAGPWSRANPILTADLSYGESFLWQPFVLTHKGQYWMFYVGSGVPWKGWDRANNWRAKDFGKESTQGPYGIHLATSKDGVTWTRHSSLPLFTDSPFAFTPFVMPLENGWAMYYAGAQPASINGKHAIITRTSEDLIHWGNRRVALIDGSDTTPWPERSFFHSPVVFNRGRSWYLMAGPITENNQSRFSYRKVFRSEDPFSWTASKHVKGLFLEGAANLVRDESGAAYLTHSGSSAGGVWMAPMLWNEERNNSHKKRVDGAGK